MCVALEMEPVMVNLGIDEAVLTILARVEEIMKRDVQTLSKTKNHNAHLQQKLNRMADQMESKVYLLSNFFIIAQNLSYDINL